MNIITKEYHSSVKKNLQNRNNISTNEYYCQGSYPCGPFILWVYAIVCFVIIPLITKMHFVQTRKIFTLKGIILLMNNFYLAGVISKVLLNERDVSLGKIFLNLIAVPICISIKNFSEARGLLLVFR